MTLLTVSNLSVSFRTARGVVEAVRGVSFGLAKGEMLALVGESGSGKSVTALSLLQLLPGQAFYPSGSIVFREQELMNAPPALLRSVRGGRVGMVFQEPMSALNPLHRIGGQIGECLAIHQPKLPRAAMRARVLELLEEVGLAAFKDRLDAYPHQLSGGERQRVLIAMAIANNPDILIADEPTTALDVSLQAQILTLLDRLRRTRGMAILLITHDLNLVRRVADRVAIMRRGEIVEQGEVARIFAQPAHAYTRELLNAAPRGAPAPLAKDASVLLSAQGLSVDVPGSGGGPSFPFFRKAPAKIIIRPLSLEVKTGETLGVVGESGSGKTTLGLAIMRLMRSRGTLRLDGAALETLSGSALRRARRHFQMVFQDPYGSLNPRMNAGDIVSEGLRVHEPTLSAREREARLDAILEEVGLSPEMKPRYPHEFSGGQRQRLAIARVAILRPKLMILDEPTSALDRSVAVQVLELLRSLQEKYGISYLFISHDLAVIRAVSHRVMVLKAGETVEEGSAEAVFAAPKHPYTKQLLEAALLHAGPMRIDAPQ